jgi:hypothetical protein
MKTIQVPDLTIGYVIGSDKIAIDPVEGSKKIDEIIAARDGCTNYEHLDDFKAWVKERTGVEITIDVADWLMDSIRLEVHREKKERMDGLLNSSRPTPDSTLPE